MAKHENLPFPIGTTYFDGQTADTTTATATNLEGKEYEIEDLNYSASTFSATKTQRTAFLKRVRVMRNVSGVALVPGNLCAPQESGTDGRFFLGRTNGYSNIGGSAPGQTIPAYGIDEFLPSAGVPNNDLFYATVDGPFLGITSSVVNDLSGTSSGAATVMQVGDVLCAATNAASTNTTNISTAAAGKLANLTLNTLTGLTLAAALLNRVGRALSALTTTSQTTAAMLMYFTKF